MIEKLKEKYNGTTEHEVLTLQRKINNIIDYLNKRDKDIEKYKSNLDNIIKMKEEEHKLTMEIGKSSKDMMKKMVDGLNSN